MVIAAIDSAEVSGLAVLARDPLLARERLLFHDAATIRTAGDVVEAVDALLLFRPDFFVVEEPFISFKNSETGRVLAILFGRWQQQIELRGFAALGVPASMWQPKVLPGFFPKMRSAERKAAAQSLALRDFGVTVGPDEADAIGLGLFAARNSRERGA